MTPDQQVEQVSRLEAARKHIAENVCDLSGGVAYDAIAHLIGNIPFTDFPVKEIVFYLEGTNEHGYVLMLKEER
jgi:hypothetical protein